MVLFLIRDKCRGRLRNRKAFLLFAIFIKVLGEANNEKGNPNIYYLIFFQFLKLFFKNKVK